MPGTAVSHDSRTLQEQIKKIFDVVVDSPPSERTQLLSRLCGSDSQLHSEISSLLAAEERGWQLRLKGLNPSFSVSADETHHTLGTGQVIAHRFEILRLIACGGMGEVYGAWDRELQQTVALKTISRDIVQYPGILARFKSEVKESLRITHPNVCRVYQLSSSTEAPEQTVWFLTMELLDGPTLAQYLRERGRLPWRRARRLSPAAELPDWPARIN